MKEKFIPPFRRFVIQNFPFIEADFDALTSYELWSKVVEYLNKVIKSQNEITAEMQQYIDYINNYFDDLDVTEEIDAKLDEMAENGELADIIAEYIQLRGVLAYDTVNAMANAENVVDGSACRTLGKTTYDDGEGRFYRVRNIVNTDVVDGVNIIGIVHNNSLVAELLPDDTISDVDTLKTDVQNLQNVTAKKHLVVIGDSHSTTVNVPAENAWYTIVARKLGLTLHNYAVGGTGYVRTVSGSNFSTQADEAIADTDFNNNDVEVVIVYGGINDLSDADASSQATNCASLCDKINNNFPNAKLFIVGINCGATNFALANGGNNLYYFSLMKQACYAKNAIFINSCFWIRKGTNTNNPFYNNENNHPNELGDKTVATNMLNAMYGTSAVLGATNPNVRRYSASTGTGTIDISASGDYLFITGNVTTDGNGDGEFDDSDYLLTNQYSPQYLVAYNTYSSALVTYNQSTHKLHIDGSAGQSYYFRTVVALNP